jgi:hypothetical protein
MKLRQLYEAPQRKVAVAAFGRMNPPTVGHEKLANMIKSFDGDHYIFLSQTVKPKTDPLPFDVKLEFAKKFFPGVNVGHPSVRTPIQMLQMLEKLGYTDVIYVAGSDRVASFDKLFNDYNGKEYNFNSIDVVSAGERDPDAEGVEGMSASKLKKLAAEGKFEDWVDDKGETQPGFARGVPKPELAQKMYDAVRTGMGIKDKEPVEEWVGPALKGGKYAFQIAKFFWNNKWAITFLAVTWKTVDWIGDAIEFVRKYTDNPIVQGLMRYGLPAVGVAVALYGGKKLYDELIKAENEEDLEKALKDFKPDMSELEKLEAELRDMANNKETNEIMSFGIKRSPKRATIKKKPEKFEPSIQDKIAARRKAYAKGDKDAFASGKDIKEASPITDLKKIISSKVYKKEYLMALKMMKQETISAADAARRFMHVDARTLDTMANKMDI